MNGQPPPPPQPETIVIECSAQNAIRTSDSYDEWEVAIPPIQLYQGDEIGVNQSFLEARGTSTEILEFSSSGLNQNNKQRIMFEYYACDDGTNDKNKGRDWVYWGTGDGTTANPALHETAKTYLPCKAIRYDHLLEESLINANGNELKRTIEGQTYNTTLPTDLDPRVANAFSINYKEDILVPGLFNSVNATKEVRRPETAIPYVGDINTNDLSNQDRLLTFNDNIVNLDGLEYWEMEEDAFLKTVTLRTPFLNANENYMGSFPIGTAIWMNWIPKRRQMSCYDQTNLNHDIPYQNFQQYPEISRRVGDLCGHFVIVDNNTISNFVDSGHDGQGVLQQFGYHGKQCIETTFSLVTNDLSPNIACPNINGVNADYMLIDNVSGLSRHYVNPWTTQSKVNLLAETIDSGPNLLITDPCPVNMVIRKSPLYIGTGDLSIQEDYPLPESISLCPLWMPDVSVNWLLPGYDPTIEQLFPKKIEDTGKDIPLFLGCYHKENLKNTESYWTDFDARDSRLPFNQLGPTQLSTPVTVVDYWTTNVYKPWGYDAGSVVTRADLGNASTTIEISVTPPNTYANRLISPEGNIIVVGRGTPYEELIMVGKMVSITDDGGVIVADPSKFTFDIKARNLMSNMASVGGGGDLPNNGIFDNNHPVFWIRPSVAHNFTYATIAAGAKVEWWDWNEAKSMTVELDINFSTNFPKGLPVTKNTGYWGNNEPSINFENFPVTVQDNNYYSPNLKKIYDYGYTYFLYYNRVGLEGNSDTNVYDLPFNQYEDLSGGDNWLSGKGGLNKNVWIMPLTQSLYGDSEKSTLYYGQQEYPSLTVQVRNSSISPNASSTSYGWVGQFNPHIPVNNMNFDFEINLSKIDPDGGGVYERNFYIWTPDIKEFRTPSSSSIHYKWSNQGLYYYLGWIPICNTMDIATTKDYLTPTDLSNFWTETLHKSQDIKNLYDGNVIPKSKNRGILQNPLLMPIYGSWGYYNYPKKDGLLSRDYFTFPQTNGYAIGSVCFIDGHQVASDWTWSGTNAYVNDAVKNNTFYIYPRSPNNIIHLFQSSTNFAMPTYTVTRNTAFDGLKSGTYEHYPTRTYLWREEVAGALTGPEYYPSAPSGKSNNAYLSDSIPGGTDVITEGNLSYTVGGQQNGDPGYSQAPTDTFDLWAKAADVDYPFTGATAQREDAIYRQTENYPIKYYSDSYYDNYLKFSQYIGCDNMTLTYNSNVSAFEFQFLHQPFSTSYSVSGGQGQGGDNAVRVFDNIPGQVGNWERYSGINMRNWACPIITRGQFTYGEIQNRPAFLQVKYPNGINPETDLDLIGDRFMSKLGFLKSQYSPKTGTMVKGIEGFGQTPNLPNLYAYEPNGTTGADTDIADAIINTSISAEDNPNADAHGGLGQLIFYPSSQDANTNNIRHTGNPGADAVADGVRYDFCYNMFGQRGGLKTANHNKAMGYPNVVGTPQVEDVLTFPRTLNPDGEQRSGYTIEIGSSPLRALTLPIKLTDGYYYILCPDLIDDPQFYITANNGSVIPAIAIVSKTYVSGDFYTTFQSPIRFYCKKSRVITSIKVQIRNSSLGVPSNLGANSSVIFSIHRYQPPIVMPPMDTSSQQTLDYSVINTKSQIQGGKSSVMNTINDMSKLAQSIIQPQADEADYIGGLQARINQHDIAGMSSVERKQFFNTPVGTHLATEIGNLNQLQAQLQNEAEQPANTLVEQNQVNSDRLLEAIRISAREGIGRVGGVSRSDSMETALSDGASGTIETRATGTTDPLGKLITGPMSREVRDLQGINKEDLEDKTYIKGTRIPIRVVTKKIPVTKTDGTPSKFFIKQTKESKMYRMKQEKLAPDAKVTTETVKRVGENKILHPDLGSRVVGDKQTAPKTAESSRQAEIREHWKP